MPIYPPLLGSRAVTIAIEPKVRAEVTKNCVSVNLRWITNIRKYICRGLSPGLYKCWSVADLCSVVPLSCCAVVLIRWLAPLVRDGPISYLDLIKPHVLSTAREQMARCMFLLHC